MAMPTEPALQVHLAWRIFFPEKIQEVTSKEEVKKRLRMVLVADRCGMSPASLGEMKMTIVKALQVRPCGCFHTAAALRCMR
jgi:hypothetical protein